MNQDFVPDHQTEFGAEEPLFESVYQPVTEEEARAKKAARRKIVGVVGMGASLVLVLVGVMAWLFSGQRDTTNQVTETPMPTATATPLSGWPARIQALKSELEAADPARQSLSFPQVDMELRLDELPRNQR